jgi:hypothetical protein
MVCRRHFTQSGMKCNSCNVLMLKVKIDYRDPESLKTAREPIGSICPVCNRFQLNTFWDKLRQRKESEKRAREQLIGYKKKPRFGARFPCYKCRYPKPKLRKLPISENNPIQHWKGTCPRCGDVWTQNHPD